mgnify:CR=1 FL=1
MKPKLNYYSISVFLLITLVVSTPFSLAFDYEGKEFSQATQDYDFNFRKYNPEFTIFMRVDR